MLNPFRGLLVVDISTADRPQLRGRMRISGNPSQMYVRNGVAYVLMNDYYDWRAQAPKFGAKVLAVDVSDPNNLELIGQTDVRGSMTDSRIVGDGPKAKLLTSPVLSRLFGTKLRVVKRGANYEVVSG